MEERGKLDLVIKTLDGELAPKRYTRKELRETLEFYADDIPVTIDGLTYTIPEAIEEYFDDHCEEIVI